MPQCPVEWTQWLRTELYPTSTLNRHPLPSLASLIMHHRSAPTTPRKSDQSIPAPWHLLRFPYPEAHLFRSKDLGFTSLVSWTPCFLSCLQDRLNRTSVLRTVQHSPAAPFALFLCTHVIRYHDLPSHHPIFLCLFTCSLPGPYAFTAELSQGEPGWAGKKSSMGVQPPHNNLGFGIHGLSLPRLSKSNRIDLCTQYPHVRRSSWR